MPNDMLLDVISAALKEQNEEYHQYWNRELSKRETENRKNAVTMTPVVEAAKLLQQEARGLKGVNIDIAEVSVSWRWAAVSWSGQARDSGIWFQEMKSDEYGNERSGETHCFQKSEDAIAFMVERLGRNIAWERAKK